MPLIRAPCYLQQIRVTGEAEWTLTVSGSGCDRSPPPLHRLLTDPATNTGETREREEVRYVRSRGAASLLHSSGCFPVVNESVLLLNQGSLRVRGIVNNTFYLFVFCSFGLYWDLGEQEPNPAVIGPSQGDT